MQTQLMMQKDRFFSIKNNNTIEEFSSISDAIESGDNKFVLIDRFDRTYTPNNGTPWRISKFIFIDKNQEVISITNNGWTLNSVDFYYKSSSRLSFDIEISDFTTSLKRFKEELLENRKYGDNNSHDLNAILKAVQKLYECSVFHDWKQLGLEEENKGLKRKIDQLKAQIVTLKTVTK